MASNPLISDQVLLRLAIAVGAPVDIGPAPGGHRRCIPLLGGSVEGVHSGVVVPGGSDWQTIRPDGTLEIDARYALQLGEGVVEVHSTGLRAGRPDVLRRLAAGAALPAADYYFRTAMRFTTSAPALLHLNDLLAIAVGERLAKEVRLSVYAVL